MTCKPCKQMPAEGCVKAGIHVKQLFADLCVGKFWVKGVVLAT